VRQVLDGAHTVHPARPHGEVLTGALVGHLAADVDDAVLGVEADVALDVMDVLVAEHLALDLLHERGVVQALLGGRATATGRDVRRGTLQLAGVRLGLFLVLGDPRHRAGGRGAE